jgi:hypothetical protein
MAGKREIYTHEFPHDVYSLAASARTGPLFGFRFAVGSFIEEYRNKVQVVQLNEEAGEFVVRATIEHPYPTTRVQWAPEPLCNSKDLLATSGDYLRIWNIDGDEARNEVTLKNVRAAHVRARAEHRRREHSWTHPVHTPTRRTRAPSFARPSRPSTGTRWTRT